MEGQSVNEKQVEKHTIREDENGHYSLITHFKDGTWAYSGGFGSKRTARIARAKRELGIPFCVKTWWIDKEVEGAHPLPSIAE